MNARPPRLSPLRLLMSLLLPLVAYTVIHTAVGSATTALALTTSIPALWLIAVGVVHRRIDPVGVIVLVTTVAALAAYALTGGDALALKLRRGAVTGPLGIVALASVALGGPLLLLVAENVAKLNPDRRDEIDGRLADPSRRRMITVLTAIVGAFMALDGVSQVVLALTVPTSRFVADSTAARILVLGTGLVITTSYLRRQRQRLQRAPTRSR